MLIGWWVDQPILIPAIFLFAYLARQLYNAVRLCRWLPTRETDPPENLGLLAHISDRVVDIKNQSLKESDRDQSVIDNLKGIVDAFPDAILLIDSDDNIRFFNDPAVRLFRLNALSDKGRAVTRLLRGPTFADWLSGQDINPSELEIPFPGDNDITLRVSAVRFRENQRLLILRDISDVQSLERMRRDLVANVSHELRTPLTVLLGYLEMLKTQKGKPDPKAIKRMYKQARQMQALLEDLLELSSLQESTGQDGMSEVDIPALLAQLEEQAVDIDQGDHKLDFDVQPSLKLWGTEADLASAFQNLIVNAIRYTPDRGSIKVSWREMENSLVLSVKDSGIGIPGHDIPRITERFYRVDSDRNRQTGGTGLGLAIVKHVLNSHDARLEVSSTLGEGSEFRCVFPLSRKA